MLVAVAQRAVVRRRHADRAGRRAWTTGCSTSWSSGPMSRAEFLRVFPKVFSGPHVDHPARHRVPGGADGSTPSTRRASSATPTASGSARCRWPARPCPGRSPCWPERPSQGHPLALRHDVDRRRPRGGPRGCALSPAERYAGPPPEPAGATGPLGGFRPAVPVRARRVPAAGLRGARRRPRRARRGADRRGQDGRRRVRRPPRAARPAARRSTRRRSRRCRTRSTPSSSARYGADERRPAHRRQQRSTARRRSSS